MKTLLQLQLAADNELRRWFFVNTDTADFEFCYATCMEAASIVAGKLDSVTLKWFSEHYTDLREPRPDVEYDPSYTPTVLDHVRDNIEELLTAYLDEEVGPDLIYQRRYSFI